ncbi:MAG: protein kinase domain-containing protein, partial [Rhabdochlamydiaceae bacterium]
VYSHVRVDNVASKIFEYCEVNKQFFSKTTAAQIENKILIPLNQRTSNKYHKVLQDVIDQLKLFTPPSQKPVLEPSPPLPQINKWMWPPNTSVLDVTAKDKAEIDAALSAIFSVLGTANLTLEKKQKGARALIIRRENQPPQTISLPLNFTFLEKNGQLTEILLLTKKIVGQGAERTVKLCYNLTTGKYYVKKKVSAAERIIMDHFMKNPGRGIAPIWVFREVPNVDPPKVQIIEPLYAGSLLSLLENSPPTKTEEKLSLIQDLLHGLSYLHAYIFPDTFYINSENKKVPVKGFKAFHFDINPNNILVRKVGNKWEAVISDFGFVGDVTIMGGTIGYQAPEEVSLQLRENPLNNEDETGNPKKVVQHNLLYGQLMDIWSMGLVMTEIMAGKLTTIRCSEEDEDLEIAPLPCLERCFLDNSNKYYEDAKTALLKQANIDQDLLNLKTSAQSSDAAENRIINTIYDLIRLMLQIRPQSRISAEEALQKLNETAS